MKSISIFLLSFLIAFSTQAQKVKYSKKIPEGIFNEPVGVFINDAAYCELLVHGSGKTSHPDFEATKTRLRAELNKAGIEPKIYINSGSLANQYSSEAFDSMLVESGVKYIILYNTQKIMVGAEWSSNFALMIYKHGETPGSSSNPTFLTQGNSQDKLYYNLHKAISKSKTFTGPATAGTEGITIGTPHGTSFHKGYPEDFKTSANLYAIDFVDSDPNEIVNRALRKQLDALLTESRDSRKKVKAICDARSQNMNFFNYEGTYLTNGKLPEGKNYLLKQLLLTQVTEIVTTYSDNRHTAPEYKYEYTSFIYVIDLETGEVYLPSDSGTENFYTAILNIIE